jgi:predicted transcriptional regulator
VPKPNVGKKSPDAINAAVRAGEALRLRCKGKTYNQIAKVLGVSSGSVYNYISTALRELREQTAETAEELRELELSKYDAWQQAAEQVLEQGDETAQLHAIDRLLRVSERRSKLLGLDAPAKQEISGSLGLPMELQAEMGRLTHAELIARAEAITAKLREEKK